MSALEDVTLAAERLPVPDETVKAGVQAARKVESGYRSATVAMLVALSIHHCMGSVPVKGQSLSEPKLAWFFKEDPRSLGFHFGINEMLIALRVLGPYKFVTTRSGETLAHSVEIAVLGKGICDATMGGAIDIDIQMPPDANIPIPLAQVVL